MTIPGQEAPNGGVAMTLEERLGVVAQLEEGRLIRAIMEPKTSALLTPGVQLEAEVIQGWYRGLAGTGVNTMVQVETVGEGVQLLPLMQLLNISEIMTPEQLKYRQAWTLLEAITEGDRLTVRLRAIVDANLKAEYGDAADSEGSRAYAASAITHAVLSGAIEWCKEQELEHLPVVEESNPGGIPAVVEGEKAPSAQADEPADTDRCTCGNGEGEEDRAAVLRCPVHGPDAGTIPYGHCWPHRHLDPAHRADDFRTMMECPECVVPKDAEPPGTDQGEPYDPDVEAAIRKEQGLNPERAYDPDYPDKG